MTMHRLVVRTAFAALSCASLLACAVGESGVLPLKEDAAAPGDGEGGAGNDDGAAADSGDGDREAPSDDGASSGDASDDETAPSDDAGTPDGGSPADAADGDAAPPDATGDETPPFDATAPEDAADDGSIPPPDAATPTSSSCAHPEEPSVGALMKIYSSSPSYINDHTIVRGADGTWHLFGITHAEPANPQDEKTLAHATAPSLMGPWTKQPDALAAAAGETVLWAPHVIRDGNTYYMFYCGGGFDHKNYQIRLATSSDLTTWTRYPTLFTDGYDARDPMVLRVGAQWVLYYTATSAASGGNYVVAYRTSTDLVNWGQRQIAFTHPTTGTSGGPTESPFVVRRGDDYYLFIGPRDGYGTTAKYSDTAVYHSKDPLHFEPRDQVYNFPAHAAEIVVDADGSYYATHAGWGEGGVYLAPLEWKPTTCETLSGNTYTATLETAPRAGLRSFEMSGKDLLSTMFRTTGPYLGVGAFATHMAGAPAEAKVSSDHKTITLRSIDFQGLPIRADWTLCAGDDALGQRLAWQVDQATSGVYEAGLGLSTALPNVRDDANPNNLHPEYDVSGFPRWVMLSDAGSSLALAYVQGSSWRTDNHWLSSVRATASIQPIWKDGGTSWGKGTYSGGVYYLGGSAQPNDTKLANTVSSTSFACNPVP